MTEQKMKEQVTALKARIFDNAELIASYETALNERNNVLMEIVKVLGIEAGEDGSVRFADIIDEIKKLTVDAAQEL